MTPDQYQEELVRRGCSHEEAWELASLLGPLVRSHLDGGNLHEASIEILTNRAQRERPVWSQPFYQLARLLRVLGEIHKPKPVKMVRGSNPMLL